MYRDGINNFWGERIMLWTMSRRVDHFGYIPREGESRVLAAGIAVRAPGAITR